MSDFLQWELKAAEAPPPHSLHYFVPSGRQTADNQVEVSVMLCSYFLLVVLLTLSSDSVSGYSNGKVSVACGGMIPQHGYEPSLDPPPYNLTVDTPTFSSGDHIIVSLQVASSNPGFFMGFLIEAQDAGKLNSPAVGSFSLIDPHESQLLQCGHTQRSAVSHRRSSRKTHIQVLWHAPKNPPPRVQFLVTVVQRYEVYWVRTAGPVVFLRGATAAPSTAVPATSTAVPAPSTAVPATSTAVPAPSTAVPATSTAVPATSTAVPATSTAVPATSTAVPAPSTAVPATSTAVPAPSTTSTALSALFTSFGCGLSKSCLRDPVSCQPESDPNCFFLSFTADGSDSSVMFELSGPADGYVSFALSLDQWMGNDDAYLCVNNGDGVSINAADVSGRTPPELATEGALWGKAWRLADGVIQCRFHRNNFQPHRFNFNQSYFLFLAHGSSHRGVIHRHDRQPLISSSQKVIVGPPEDLCGSRSPLLIKLHGVLMLTAWMWITSSSVLITRHYKQLRPDFTLLGHKLWFQLHRTVMLSAAVITVLAFMLPFIYMRGWSNRSGSHPYIGCAVMVLSVIQPIMGLLRPAPESPRRIIFKWIHFGGGTAAQILAVCVFQGQQALLLPNPWSPAALAGWTLWIVLTDLLLLIHSCKFRDRGDNKDKQGILVDQSEKQQHEEISKVKKIVLLVFLTGNTGFLAAFINAIARS